jgi:hypothetical protein
MLADILPALIETKMTPRVLTRSEVRRRWKVNNRAKFNAYRRQWRQARREKGFPVT